MIWFLYSLLFRFFLEITLNISYIYGVSQVYPDWILWIDLIGKFVYFLGILGAIFEIKHNTQLSLTDKTTSF